MRHGEAKDFGGLEVDHHLEFRDLLDRQISGFVAPNDPPSIDAGLAVRLHKIAAVTREAAGDTEVARLLDRRHRVTSRKGSQLFTMEGEEGVGGDHKSARPQLGQGCERGVDVLFGAGVQDMKLQSERVPPPGGFWFESRQ